MVATDALGYGWRGFKAYAGPVLSIAAVVIIINLVSAFLRGMFDSSLLSFGLSLIDLAIGVFIGLGLVRAALTVVDGRAPSVEQLLSPDRIGPYLVASIVAGIAVVIGMIFCFIPGLIIGFLLQFYAHAIIDGRTGLGAAPSPVDPIGALRASFDIVTANVGAVIVLDLLLLGVNILGALACGIGLLVTLPLSGIALAFAWRRLTAGQIAALA